MVEICVIEKTDNDDDDSSPNITPKMRELQVELSMVDKEINRLERLINGITLRQNTRPTPPGDGEKIHGNIWCKGVEEDEKWPANKLSENIIKCLVFIYVKILRTGTDKPRMFNEKATDPYGIFDSKESIPRDIGPYSNLLRFTSKSMDLSSPAFPPLLQRLKILIDGLQRVELTFLTHQQKLAFWINMHNACIMHGYLRSEKTPKQATLDIAGNLINAETIEHFILRKTPDSVEKQVFQRKEMIIEEMYGLERADPNVTFALCYATRSSPQMKIYTAENVSRELEKSKVEYLEAAIVVKNTKKIGIPELLLKHMHDFGDDICAFMEWLCHQVPATGSLRKSIIDCFGGLRRGCNTSSALEMIPSDFEFQYLLPP